MSEIFLTSDTHFSHEFIRKAIPTRPGVDLGDHDQILIDNWNGVVGKEDTVYHLGDFIFIPKWCRGNQKKREYFLELLGRLNGKIFVVPGNHDHSLERSVLSGQGILLLPIHRIKVGKLEVVLCHYAMRAWWHSHWGVFHAYGHSHGSLPDLPNSRSADVGVDCHEYKPFHFERFVRLMEAKTFEPVDHHGRLDSEEE